MSDHEKINYLEFASSDLNSTKAFFNQVFNWQFTDYGDEYCSFNSGNMTGGFYQAPLCSRYQENGSLVVFYSENLAATQQKIEDAGGTIVKPVFSFPGGRRFHFAEPAGNEFAVWSDK